VIGILAAAVVAAAWPGDWQPNAAQMARLAKGEVVVEVLPDPGRSSGLIHAAIEIRTPVQRIWKLLTACDTASRIVKFVTSCRIISHGPPDTWELREDIIEPAFFLPHIRSVIRADDDPMRSIKFRCVPGSDLRICDGSWRLEPAPDGAVRVIYASAVSSPYPAPDWVIRTIIGGGMSDSMRTLQRKATAPGP
jgi:hypothetical protein